MIIPQLPDTKIVHQPMSTTLINENVILHPHELGDINRYICEKLEEKVGSCTKERGYITAIVYPLSKIHHNLVSRQTGNVIVNVSYEIETVKPCIGMICTALVNIVHKEGLFARMDYVDIIVPATTFDEHLWTCKENQFVNDDCTIEVGSWIKVQITNVRYTNSNFQCIAKIE